MIKVNIDYASDDSCQIQLWAKGTHAAEVFLPACEDALVTWDERQMSLAGKPVSHKHWRTVQADAETKANGVCDTVHVESKEGRGAYAVTVLDEWLPLHCFHTTKIIGPAISALHTALEQQAEPPPEWLLIKNILDEYGLDAIAFVAAWKAVQQRAEPVAQRPWVGLTEEDWGWVADRKGTSLDTFDQGATWAAYKLERRNK